MQGTVQSRFGHRAVFIMSIIQISCGVLSVVIGGVQIKEDQMLGAVGYGMWTGFFFIIAGILGITSWKFKDSGNIIAHMVMSIIACIFGWILFGIAVPSVAYASYGYYCSNSHIFRGYYYSPCAAPIALGVILVIISLLEIVVSIVSSAYCCRAVCCGVHSSTPGTVVQYNVPPRGQAVVMAPGVYPHGYVMPAGQQGGQVIYLNQSAPVQMPVHQGQVSYQVQAVPAMGMHVQNQPAMVTVPSASSHTSTVMSPVGVQPSVVSANASASPNNPPVCNTLDNSKTKEGNFEYTRLDEENK